MYSKLVHSSNAISPIVSIPSGSDMLFRRGLTEIGYTDGKYYLIDYSADEGTYLREVPAEYNDIFEKICEKQIESDYDFYSEDYEYEENVIYDYSA